MSPMNQIHPWSRLLLQYAEIPKFFNPVLETPMSTCLIRRELGHCWDPQFKPCGKGGVSGSHFDFRDGQEMLKEDMMSQWSVPKRLDCLVHHHFLSSFRTTPERNSFLWGGARRRRYASCWELINEEGRHEDFIEDICRQNEILAECYPLTKDLAQEKARHSFSLGTVFTGP